MNIKSFAFLTATTIILSTGAANANMLFDIYAGGTYGIGGHTLFTKSDDISKSSQSYGAVLGMKFPLLRIELEYNYLDTDIIKMDTGFVNLYFNIPTPIIKPYIGGGIGYAVDSTYKPKNGPKTNIDETMTYQAMLGITLDLPAIPFDIDVEGRVMVAPDLMTDVDLLQYEGRAKLRYIF